MYYLKGQEFSKVNCKYLCLTRNQVSILVHAGSFPLRLDPWSEGFLHCLDFLFACGGCEDFKDKIYTSTYDLETIKAPTGYFWFHLKGWEIFEPLCCDLAFTAFNSTVVSVLKGELSMNLFHGISIVLSIQMGTCVLSQTQLFANESVPLILWEDCNTKYWFEMSSFLWENSLQVTC